MSAPNARLIQLGKILLLEAKQGYEDRAVMGGLEAFVNAMSADIDASLAATLKQFVSQYASQPHPQRVDAIRELADVLQAPNLALDLSNLPTQSSANAAKHAEKPGAQAPNTQTKAFSLPLLDAGVGAAKGVGARREKAFVKLGIRTIEDLLIYFPRKIEDRTIVQRIGQVRDGDRVTVIGTVRALETVRPRPKFEILKATVQDGSGLIYAVWFNQPWLKTQLKQGQKVALFGEVSHEFGQVQMSNPVWEPAEQKLFTQRLVPVYPATKGVLQASLIRIIRDNVRRYRDKIQELLPEEVRQRERLLPRAKAIAAVHFPESHQDFELARNTLAFEELFLFQLGVGLHRAQTNQIVGRSLSVDDSVLDDFAAAVPFKLTRAQQRAIDDIRSDLFAPHPMNRLLQGDVGSGKTAVAAAACLMVTVAGYQSCLMAPTEILARQHAEGLRTFLEPLGVRTGLMVGGLKKSEKKEIRAASAAGDIDLLIGTHALIEDSIAFKNPGLAVIDEQHRFGVIQRAKLEQKGKNLDVLVMSATPIPRTVVLTLYGQFEVSVLDELPFEKQIRTYWISEDRRHEVYALVANDVKEGVQAYVVYPLVEESEASDLRAAVQMKEELASGPFKGLIVGLLHGQMKDDEKRDVMRQLMNKQIQVLVSTTVVEVGIDVPDASLMVIEHAERFGLSQLHQLRGRIGRAGQKSTCFAIATAKTDEARARLEVFCEHLDGFKIAEADLEIRGPGELLGLAQHGLDNTFRAADLIRDLKLMQRARSEALRHLNDHPNSSLIDVFRQRYGDRFDLAFF